MSGQAAAEPARVDASPFDLGPRDGAAALCLHGLTGTPYEVRSIGEAIAAGGMRALGPALPGHNATPHELARVTYTAWLEAARTHLRGLREAHGRIFVVGLSLGGLLTLALAEEEPLDGAAVIATPLRLRFSLAGLIPLVKHLYRFAPKVRGADIRDPAARARHPSYEVMPLAAVHELQRLQRHVRTILRRIETPLLVAHGAHDATADPEDARRIFESVGSERRELLVLEDSAHVVPVDFDAQRLAEAVAAFFQGCPKAHTR